MSAKAWGDIPRAGGAALRLLVCLLLSLLAAPLAAEYRFDRWTTEHELPNDSVNAVVQTRDGYLWLATNDGLARFDGVRFKVFDRGNTDGRIGSNRLTALAEDRDGTLWAGTYEGLLVRYRAGEFSTFTAEHGLPYGPIYWIEEDARGGLWLVGNQNLTRWQAERGVSYDLTACLPGRQQDPPAQQRRVWWSTDAAGLHLFHGGRVQTYTRQGGLPSLNINQVEPDRRGNVWVGTSDAGLVKLKDGKPTVYPLDGKWWPGELTGGMAHEDRQRQVWLLTTVGAGSDSVVVSLRGGRLMPHPAVKGSVAYFCEDREGTLWIGTNEGLHRARPTAIQPLTDEARRRDRLGLNEWVYAVLEDRSGAVWFGKWGGGVGRYRDGRFTHYVGGPEWQAALAAWKTPPATVTHEAGLYSSRVTSLYEDRAGTVWVGTDGGVSRFEGGRFVRYSDQHGLASVWAMSEDRAGNFWFGTTTGLTRWRDGAFTVYTARDGLAHDDVKVIHEDRRGALWLGTHGGLTRYLDGRFTTLPEFGPHQVRAIYEDADGVLWVGTYGSGLFRFDGAKFTRYTTDDGLFNNGVFQILEDARGRFWMGSNKGVSRVSREELNAFAAGRVKSVTAVPYGKDDGLLNVECNGGRQPAGWKTRDGRLWLPTMNGVAVIDPAAVPINPVAPPVVIEEVLLDRQPQDFRRGVRIEPGQSQFEVRYTGLSFIKPELVRFKYRLAGLHAEWIDAGTRRAADFSYVPPGEYVFEVVAANSDGVWNERGASLRIIVVPPPWRRWWFYALVCAGLAGAALFAYRLRVGHLRRETEEATRRRIQAQEGERQRIADRLHDSLGQQIINIRNSALQGLQPAAAEQTGGQARARLAEISATASEAFHEVREIIHDLRPHLLEELGLTETLRSMIRRAAGSSGIRFNDDLKDVDGVLPQDAELAFYRAVQECVNNVVRHSGARAASVTLRRDAGWLRLRVADDGRGFTTEAVTYSRERGGGFGLLNLRDLTRLLGGQLEITTAPGEGTVVTVSIPTPGSLERKP